MASSLGVAYWPQPKGRTQAFAEKLLPHFARPLVLPLSMLIYHGALNCQTDISYLVYYLTHASS